MGIKQLYPFIQENAPKACERPSSQANYNGRILAIDASTCLYQFLVAIRSGTFYRGALRTSGAATPSFLRSWSSCIYRTRRVCAASASVVCA